MKGGISFETQPDGSVKIERSGLIKELIDTAGIPVRYMNAVLNEKTAVTKQLKKLKDGSAVILSGGYGCGKSYGVCAYLIKKIKDNNGEISGIIIDANKLYNRLKREPKYIDEISYQSILIIDDLGMEYDPQTGYFYSLLDEIINDRYNSSWTTIITTNLNKKKFKDRYSGRIIDRLKEWGSFFESNEKSFRQKSA